MLPSMNWQASTSPTGKWKPHVVSVTSPVTAWGGPAGAGCGVGSVGAVDEDASGDVVAPSVASSPPVALALADGDSEGRSVADAEVPSVDGVADLGAAPGESEGRQQGEAGDGTAAGRGWGGGRAHGGSSIRPGRRRDPRGVRGRRSGATMVA